MRVVLNQILKSLNLLKAGGLKILIFNSFFLDLSPGLAGFIGFSRQGGHRNFHFIKGKLGEKAAIFKVRLMRVVLDQISKFLDLLKGGDVQISIFKSFPGFKPRISWI